MLKQSTTIEGVKIDIQTMGVELNDYLKRKLHNMIEKWKSHLPEVSGIDVYFKTQEEQASRPRTVVVRLGIPGPDLVASDSGHRWKILLKNVEKKLLRQLQKRKGMAA